MAKDRELHADFMNAALRELGEQPAGARVLDFGCGLGELVLDLAERGYAMEGCDIDAFWAGRTADVAERCRVIEREPYRLPFEDGRFDAVISSSVFEHVLNKREALEELRRVTRVDGVSIHLFPSRWYLPVEPHLRVPFAGWIHPWRPRPWFALWAALGVRNQDQQGMSRLETVESNMDYTRRGLSYWTNARYLREGRKVFGECTTPAAFLVDHGYGGASEALRRLPLPSALGGRLLRHFRMNMLFMRHRGASA